MFRSKRSDAQLPQIVTFEGAVGSAGPDAIPAIVLRMTNYDQDVKQVVTLAEIAVRDAFGDADMNGYGEFTIRTCVDSVPRDVVTVTHTGRVGIVNSEPAHALDVTGGLHATGDAVVDGALSVQELTADRGRIAHLVSLDHLCVSTFGQIDSIVLTTIWKLLGSFVWRKGDQPPAAVMCRVTGDVLVEVEVRAHLAETNTTMGQTNFAAATPIGIIPLTASPVLDSDELVTVEIQGRRVNGGASATVVANGFLYGSG